MRQWLTPSAAAHSQMSDQPQWQAWNTMGRDCAASALAMRRTICCTSVFGASLCEQQLSYFRWSTPQAANIAASSASWPSLPV